MRSNLIVLGFAPVNRFPIESVAQNESDAFLLTEVRQPLPREPTFAAAADILFIGSNDT